MSYRLPHTIAKQRLRAITSICLALILILMLPHRRVDKDAGPTYLSGGPAPRNTGRKAMRFFLNEAVRRPYRAPVLRGGVWLLPGRGDPLD